MIFKISAIFAATLLAANFSLAGNLSIVLAPNQIRPSDFDRIQQFVDQTIELLPVAVKDKFDERVTLEFIDRGDTTITPPQCPLPGNQIEPTGLTASKTDHDDKSDSKLLGRYLHVGPYLNRIQINAAFLKIVLDGEANALQYPCGHHNLYRLAQATLIHELGHIYDQKEKISRDFQFRHLVKFYRKKSATNLLLADGMIPEGWKTRNILWTRSPDPYEFKSPVESFAVGFEFFILDPEFPCRRPAVASYYAKKLGVERKHDCSVNTQIFLNSEDPKKNLVSPVDINPDRIYAIHYFLADKGTEVASRFGHAMFRLIVCAPTRDHVGPECLHDFQYHVILSFRANTSDINFSALKGIIGHYPSQLFIFPFTDVVSEYTKKELRNIRSEPLTLSAAEKENFVYNAIEQYWGYLGKYRFFSNNCVTEASALLNGVLDSSVGHQLKAFTPVQWGNRLGKNEMTDSSIFDSLSQAEIDGDFYRSELIVIEHSLELIWNKSFSAKQAILFLDQSTVVERKANFDQAILNQKLIAANYLIESVILRRKLDAFGKNVAKKMPENIHQRVQGLLHQTMRYPWMKLASGYGIPLTQDFAAPLKASSIGKDLLEDGELKKWIEANFESDLNEFKAIQENTDFLSQQLVR